MRQCCPVRLAVLPAWGPPAASIAAPICGPVGDFEPPPHLPHSPSYVGVLWLFLPCLARWTNTFRNPSEWHSRPIRRSALRRLPAVQRPLPGRSGGFGVQTQAPECSLWLAACIGVYHLGNKLCLTSMRGLQQNPFASVGVGRLRLQPSSPAQAQKSKPRPRSGLSFFRAPLCRAPAYSYPALRSPPWALQPCRRYTAFLSSLPLPRVPTRQRRVQVE